MLPELKQDFLHLERSGERLNENCCSYSPVWQPDIRLGKVEDIIPQTGFLVVFHLWKIEIWSEATSHKLLGVVEEVETEIKY